MRSYQRLPIRVRVDLRVMCIVINLLFLWFLCLSCSLATLKCTVYRAKEIAKVSISLIRYLLWCLVIRNFLMYYFLKFNLCLIIAISIFPGICYIFLFFLICLFCYLMAHQPSYVIQCQIHPPRTVVILFNP